MSPKHRPRLPRQQENPGSSSRRRGDPAENPRGPEPSTGRTSPPRSTDEPTGPHLSDARERLAEAAARADAGDTAQRAEAMDSAQRSGEHRPVAVRVNDTSKVGIEDPEEADSGIGATQAPSTKDGAGAPERGGPDGPAASGKPDNIVAFPSDRERRRARKESTAGDRRQERGGRWGRLPRGKRWLAGIGALVIAAILFLGIVFYSPLLATQTITVQGANLSDQSTVQKSLEPLKGKPLTRITDHEVQDLIGNDVVVEGVSIEARPPHELEVTVHERVPVATVKSGDQYILVDKNGVAVGSKKSVDEAGVPLLEGGPDAVKSDSFTSAVAALQTLPQSLLSQLNKVEADSPSNIRLDMKDGSQVIWGTSDDSEFKAQVLNSLVKALKDQGGASVYDVSSPDHPVTK